MPLVPAICTQCGAQIEVDNTHEAGICKHCGTAFVTEKAINNYVVNNNINVKNAHISVSGINVENLLQRAAEFENNGEKEKALEYYNRVLDENIKNEIARAGVERLTYVEKINIGGAIVSAEIGNEIIEFINAGEKVKAVQRMRAATGWELKEAVDAVELYDAQHCGNLKKDTLNNADNNTRSGGCYIATCVYGSYDCPQVWTLRRFRDYTLDETWYGRAFIKCYYAVSPTLVKWFGNQKWFKTFWKRQLDSMVYNLNRKGIDNTQYHDKY